jgi:hypothetical protein
MEKFKRSADVIRTQLQQNDFDWLHVNCGYEGVGKSTGGWHMCKIVDPTFNVDRIVFSYKQFKKCIKDSNPGEAIMIDEGAFLLFHRDAMSADTKGMVKLLTGIRSFNQFVLINLPRFFILDNYVRKYRVKTVTRVIKRGMFLFYSPYKVHRIEKGKNGKAKYPDYDYVDGYPKIEGPEWEAYKTKKHRDMIGTLDDEEKKHKGPTKVEAIQQFYKEHPDVKKIDLAKKFKCDPSYISKALARMSDD